MGLKYRINILLDTPERTMLHRKIILSKPFLKKIYIEWYEAFILELNLLPQGKVVELGAGGSFIKDLIPNIIATDILPLPTNDMTFSALKIPFNDSSVSAFFMTDTFHHLQDAQLFLTEANRVLMKNGKLIMVEPCASLWGKFIFSCFHQEPFNPQGNWQLQEEGPLSCANTALPWIVFIRDKIKFKELFPDLEIEEITFHTPFRYLLSGGVSYKQLVPDFSFPLFSKIDHFLGALSSQISMFMTIKVKKIN